MILRTLTWQGLFTREWLKTTLPMVLWLWMLWNWQRTPNPLSSTSLKRRRVKRLWISLISSTVLMERPVLINRKTWKTKFKILLTEEKIIKATTLRKRLFNKLPWRWLLKLKIKIKLIWLAKGLWMRWSWRSISHVTIARWRTCTSSQSQPRCSLTTCNC